MEYKEIREYLELQNNAITIISNRMIELFELQKEINNRINNLQEMIQLQDNQYNDTIMWLGADIQKSKYDIIDIRNNLRITSNKVSDIIEELGDE